MKRIGLVFLAVLMVVGAAGMLGCSSDDDDASIFQGTLSGTWKGSGLSGRFTVTIDAAGVVAGSYTGSDAGTISGTVDDSGAFAASATGSAGVATWTGALQSAAGHASSGSGTWKASVFSGTWTAP